MSQEKLQTVIMPNFLLLFFFFLGGGGGRRIEVYYGIVQVVNTSKSNLKGIIHYEMFRVAYPFTYFRYKLAVHKYRK